MNDRAMTTLDTVPRSAQLTDAHDRYFNAFGYLRLRGWLADVIEDLQAGFDAIVDREELEVVACHAFMDGSMQCAESYARLLVADPLASGQPLHWLLEDGRLLDLAQYLLGSGSSYLGSCANLYNCNVHWHDDAIVKAAEGRNLHALIYLDPLDACTGALRVIPGSHHRGPFGESLRRELAGAEQALPEAFGVRADEVPAVVLDVVPGDVIVIDFDLLHASFHGGVGRRMVSVAFGPPIDAETRASHARLPGALGRRATADEVARSLHHRVTTTGSTTL
ncbi:MAG: phytanoyl-CoA dioxygenase family protein [Acidimicrobiales bacterium]